MKFKSSNFKLLACLSLAASTIYGAPAQGIDQGLTTSIKAQQGITISYHYPDGYEGMTAIGNEFRGSFVALPPTVTVGGPTPVAARSEDNIYTTEKGMIDYEWTIEGGVIIAGGTFIDHTVTVQWNEEGTHSVEVNYASPRSRTRAVKPAWILVNILPAQPASALEVVDLFPNRVDQELSISNAPVHSAISICDLSGNEVLSALQGQGRTITTVNTSFLPDGMYLVKICQSRQVVTKRIVVSHR